MELGNQIIKEDLSTIIKTGKEFWSNLGCYHFSIDLNGLDGTMGIDLSLPIVYYDNFFDIVTNITVTNSIDKYNVGYDNIYRFCKDGGKIFHCLPARNSKWSKTHYAGRKFYEEMALKYSMALIDYDDYKKSKDGKLTLAAFHKNGNI